MAAPPDPPSYEPGADYELPRDLYLQVVEILRTSLPLPQGDIPDAWLRRDRLAITEVAALVPASPPEAKLAALHVACMAHAADSLRLAVLAGGDPKGLVRAYAQSARMGREARGYMNALLRLQAVRARREAKDDTRDAATWTEQSALGLMTDALASLPQGRPTSLRQAPPPAAEPEKPQKSPLRDYSEWSEEEKREEKLWSDAGRYAVLHTEQVKRIRQLGGLPPDCDYEPPPPEILEIIIHGDHPDLRWADTYVPYGERFPNG